jgi:hypothetical protein
VEEALANVRIYTKTFSNHSLKSRKTQKAVNKKSKIQKFSADSDYGACFSGSDDEEMMDTYASGYISENKLGKSHQKCYKT